MSRAAHADPAVSMMGMTLLWVFYFFPADNTAAVHTQRVGFNRQEQDVYLLPILVVDSGPPALSSTGTLTIRVCGCDSTGAIQSCNSTAYAMSATLSPGALIALLVCVLILIGECCPWAHRMLHWWSTACAEAAEQCGEAEKCGLVCAWECDGAGERMLQCPQVQHRAAGKLRALHHCGWPATGC